MKGEKMIRKISLDEFKKNVLLFPYLRKEDKTSEQFNFALDEIEKQNSIYTGKEKIILTKEGYDFVYLLFNEEIRENENLRKDIELALRGIIYDEAFILNFDDVIKQDKRVLIALAERQDYRLRFCLSEEQKEDVELLKEIISRYPSIFLGLSTKLKENKELKVIYEKNKKIETTMELSEIVIKSIGKSMKKHPSKRTFQAIRIFVNKELEVLEEALDKAINLLKDRGKLLVITFHSLEDRMVKEKFREYENPCSCPPEIPVCMCNKKSLGKVITRKPITAKESELNENNRAHSAKLRIFERKENR